MLWLDYGLIASVLFLISWFVFFTPIKISSGFVAPESIQTGDEYDQEEVCRMSEFLRGKIGVDLHDEVMINFGNGNKVVLPVRRITETERFTNKIEVSRDILFEIFDVNHDYEKEKIRVTISTSKKGYAKKILPPFIVYFITFTGTFFILGHYDLTITLSVSLILALLLSSLNIRATDFSRPFFKPVANRFKRMREFKVIGSTQKANVLITAPHAFPPSSDKNTGKLAELIAINSKIPAIISRVSRLDIDLNRGISNNHPFRKKIKEIIDNGSRPFLILDIHGMHSDENEIEIGTTNGKSVPKEILDALIETFRQHEIAARINERFPSAQNGTITSSYYNIKGKIYTIQLEFPMSMRQPENINNIAGIISEFINYFLKRIQPSSQRS